MRKSLIFTLLTLSFSSCQPEQKTRYAVRGVIQEVRINSYDVIIAHEEIPGYMDAMTMPFRVKDGDLLNGLAPKQKVLFHLVASPSDAYIERFELLGPEAPVKTNSKPVHSHGSGRPHIPEAGELAPDVVLTNQDGKTVSLKDQRGKIVAINFIYTRCPLPTFCPRSMGEFKILRNELKDRIGKDVQLFTVTFDPQNDTPPVLKKFGAGYEAQGGGWQLLTGKAQALKKWVSFFNVIYGTSPEGLVTEHTLSAVVIDRSGRVARFYSGDQVRGAAMAQDIRAMAD